MQPEIPTKWALRTDFPNNSLNKCSWDPELNMNLVKQQKGQAKSRCQSIITKGVSQRTSSLGQSSAVYEPKESSEHVWEWRQEGESFLLCYELRNARTSASSLPLVVKSGTYTLESERRGGRGGREGCLQISAISQPDCLLTQRGRPLQHISTRWGSIGVWRLVNGDMWAAERRSKCEAKVLSADQKPWEAH